MSERPRLPFEVAPGCYALDRFLGAWCYLLTGAATLLVDTGVPGRAGAILRAVAEIGIEPSAIDRIVLTHFDMDHSGSAAALHRRTGAPVVIHEARRVLRRSCRRVRTRRGAADPFRNGDELRGVTAAVRLA